MVCDEELIRRCTPGSGAPVLASVTVPSIPPLVPAIAQPVSIANENRSASAVNVFLSINFRTHRRYKEFRRGCKASADCAAREGSETGRGIVRRRMGEERAYELQMDGGPGAALHGGLQRGPCRNPG